jgi:hypothetical protein
MHHGYISHDDSTSLIISFKTLIVVRSACIILLGFRLLLGHQTTRDF